MTLNNKNNEYGVWIAFFLMLMVLLFMVSCRTVKKDWVKENFTEKTETQNIQQTLDNFNKTLKSEITETLILDFSEKLKQQSEISIVAENEISTVSGSIIAEDGKQKSATVGNTIIKSNGATINFETKSSKSLSQQFESKYQELTNELELEKIFNKNLQTEINSLKSEFANFISTYESQKNKKTRTVKKKGLTSGFTFWMILTILVLGVLYYFRYRIF